MIHILNFMMNTYTVVLPFYILNKIFECRFRSKIVNTILLLIVILFCFSSDYMLAIGSLKSIVNILAQTVMFVLIYRERPSKVALLFIFIVIFVFHMSDLLTLLLMSFLPQQIAESMLVMPLIGGSVFALVSFVLSLYIRQYVIQNYRIMVKNYKEYIIMIMFNYVIIMIFMSLQHFEIEMPKSLLFLLIVIFISLTVVTLRLLVMTTNHIISESQRSRDKLAMTLQEEQLKRLQAIIQELKKQRHEFNNHLSCVAGLADNKSYEELERYLFGILEDTTKMNLLIDSGDPVVTAIISQKIEMAQSKGIKTTVEIKFDKIWLHPVDFSILLNNLINNAIEACEQVDEDRYIDIVILQKGDYLIIEVVNSVRLAHKELDIALETTKEDSDNHGFGLQNIRDIVENYDGFLEVGPHEKDFKVKCILLNNKSLNKK